MEVPDDIPEAADLKKTLPTIIGGLIGILSFGIFMIALLWYVWKDRDDGSKEKVQKLEKVRQETSKSLNEYGWVDRKAGIAHIPIERAMEAYVKEQGK